MTPQDRELLRALNRRQAELEESLAQLKLELKGLERRAEWTTETVPPPVTLPPLPVPATETAIVHPPSLPERHVADFLPPTPAAPAIPEAHESPTPEEANPPGLEFQFGRWLARIGVVFALITLVSFSTVVYQNFYHYMGPWSKLVVLAVASLGLFGAGLRLERKNSKLIVYGRTLAGGGLACLYYTLYGATYVRQLQVISSPVFGGLLLLAWSAWVLYLAEKRKSELLSIFAISLAYFSSAITPVGEFTMAANLILALTVVIFLVRNAWTGLSYLCLIGTYLGLLRQFVVFGSGYTDGYEFLPATPFWPSAVYLAGAWLIFTTGVFLSTTPKFAAGKRMAFLCLNNGALIGLLTVASRLSSFGHIGAILCIVGGLFLATSYLARRTRMDAGEVAGAYLMQGLALATGGLMIVYTGVTRGLLITVESVFLAAAGAYSRNRIFRVAGFVSALLGTAFLIFEIGFENRYPWTLTLGGTVAMLANAWFARRDFREESREVAAHRFVWSSSYYVLLALGVLVTGIVVQHNDDWVAPDLALAALVLTFAVYLLPLFELPPLSQGLLVLAQIIAVAPPIIDASAPGAAPQWSQNIVALVTMLLVTWWPRQKLVRTGLWLQPLTIIYALAMVGFCYNAVHPHVEAQGWMISAALLSLGFLAYGAWTRSWPFMVSGQIFLVLSIETFLNPPSGAGGPFPWTWWAAAIPPATVFLTGRFVGQWLPKFLKATEDLRESLCVIASIYQSIALALLIRWVFGVVPESEVTFSFLALGTGLVFWNLRWPSAFGVRTGFVLNLIGTGNYLAGQTEPGIHAFTWADAGGFLLFLAQPALLRRWGRDLISEAESWAVIIASSGMAWLFVSNSILAEESNNLTLGWALFALGLTIVGFVSNERRQRWCGLVILLAAIIRVGVYDFWSFSDLYKVLTFFVLTIICLGLSFLYYKFADRLKEWL